MSADTILEELRDKLGERTRRRQRDEAVATKSRRDEDEAREELMAFAQGGEDGLRKARDRIAAAQMEAHIARKEGHALPSPAAEGHEARVVEYVEYVDMQSCADERVASGIVPEMFPPDAKIVRAPLDSLGYPPVAALLAVREGEETLEDVIERKPFEGKTLAKTEYVLKGDETATAAESQVRIGRCQDGRIPFGVTIEHHPPIPSTWVYVRDDLGLRVVKCPHGGEAKLEVIHDAGLSEEGEQ